METIIITYKIPVKTPLSLPIVFLCLLLFCCNLLVAKTLGFSEFMLFSQIHTYKSQNTLVFDGNQNQFKIVFCNEVPFSYQQCMKYNYYLFLNLHVDFSIQQRSEFSSQLIKSWLFHKASVYWLNLIFVEDLKYLNSNYYGVQKQDLKPLFKVNGFWVFPNALHSKFKASDEGLFSNDFTPLLFQLDDQLGFSGQGNRVFFPYIKRQDRFSFSKQKIDFIAILNHELAHTRYGLKDSDSLIGEALVVKEFENPVRVYDGFVKRKYYYSKKFMKYIDVETLEEFYISNSNSL